MRAVKLTLALLGLLLGGCAQLGGQGERPYVQREAAESTLHVLRDRAQSPLQFESAGADDPELRKALQADYEAVRAICAPLLYEYKKSTDFARYSSLAIQVVGALAGAVMVPALVARDTVPKTAVAVWGGISGVSNTLQNTVKEVGLAPLPQYQARELLRQQLLLLATKFSDLNSQFPDNFQEQIGILNLMKANCDYPPIAVPTDVSPLPNVSGSGSPQKQDSDSGGNQDGGQNGSATQDRSSSSTDTPSVPAPPPPASE